MKYISFIFLIITIALEILFVNVNFLIEITYLHFMPSVNCKIVLTPFLILVMIHSSIDFLNYFILRDRNSVQ